MNRLLAACLLLAACGTAPRPALTALPKVVAAQPQTLTAEQVDAIAVVAPCRSDDTVCEPEVMDDAPEPDSPVNVYGYPVALHPGDDAEFVFRSLGEWKIEAEAGYLSRAGGQGGTDIIVVTYYAWTSERTRASGEDTVTLRYRPAPGQPFREQTFPVRVGRDLEPQIIAP